MQAVLDSVVPQLEIFHLNIADTKFEKFCINNLNVVNKNMKELLLGFGFMGKKVKVHIGNEDSKDQETKNTFLSKNFKVLENFPNLEILNINIQYY